MKKKLFMLLALVMTTMTASAVAGYTLSVGTNEHGTIAFTDKNGQTIATAAEGETVTVTITPDAGYVVNQPSGQWYAAVAKAPRRAAADIDLLKAVDLTAAGENQWTFEMKRANVEISSTYKKLLANQDITVADIEALTYNGQAQEPTVTVSDGTTTLVLGTDYTVAYTNNTNAAQATDENAPTVTITAVATSDKYAGETTKTFTIEQADITSVSPPTARNLTYLGYAQTLVLSGSTTGGEIQYSIDGINYSTTRPKATEPGTYTVYYKVVGDANHNGTEAQTISVTITTNKTALTAAISEAEAYLESIQDNYADIAATLQESIDAAKQTQAIETNDMATQTLIETATQTLNAAVEAAKTAVENIATGIDTVGMNNGNAAAVWYDLSGRRLNAEPSTPGIYVKNGKKVVVK